MITSRLYGNIRDVFGFIQLGPGIFTRTPEVLNMVKIERITLLSTFGVALTSLLGLIAFDLGAQLGWFQQKEANAQQFVLTASNSSRSNMRVSASMQREFAQRCAVCEATAVFTSDVLPVLSRANGRSQFAEVVEYEDDFWQVLRPKLVAGRLPQPLRKGGPAGQAVVSAALWRSIFLDQPFEISSSVFIDGKPFEVVGLVTTQADDLFGRTGIWIEKQDLSGSSNTDQIGLVRTSQFAQAQAMLHAATGSLKALGGLSWASKVDGYSLRSTSAYLRSRMGLSEPALIMELAICAFCSLICFATIVFLQLLIGMKRSTIEWTLGSGAWKAMFGRAKEQSGTIVFAGLLAGLISCYANSLAMSSDLHAQELWNRQAPRVVTWPRHG